MIKRTGILLMIILASLQTILAQDYLPSDTVVYKKTSQGNLSLHVFYPEGFSPKDKRPVIVFFFGGGWVGGTPRNFYQHCAQFAKLGLVAISAEYRVNIVHHTSPFECVKDGKSAIRYLRMNAKEFGVNPEEIIAAGGSAGGHVAACTGVIEGYEEQDENLNYSSVPNAMILFSPVLDTSEKGYGAEKLKGRETEISPCHHVRPNIPPTLIFHGTRDEVVPYENAQRFERLMKEKGNDCLLIPFFGGGHAFFLSSWRIKENSDVAYNKTIYESEVFLWKGGFLEDEPLDWK